MPCPDCGASLVGEPAGGHVCDEERRASYRLFQARGEIGQFDAQLSEWLETPRGRFATWIAERDRRAA